MKLGYISPKVPDDIRRYLSGLEALNVPSLGGAHSWWVFNLALEQVLEKAVRRKVLDTNPGFSAKAPYRRYIQALTDEGILPVEFRLQQYRESIRNSLVHDPGFLNWPPNPAFHVWVINWLFDEDLWTRCPQCRKPQNFLVETPYCVNGATMCTGCYAGLELKAAFEGSPCAACGAETLYRYGKQRGAIVEFTYLCELHGGKELVESRGGPGTISFMETSTTLDSIRGAVTK